MASSFFVSPGARLVLAVVLMSAYAGTAAAAIPYRRLQLPNGLAVVVHEDHKAPVVSLAVWYRAGSADEPAGRSGFAHLFEHLAFEGSEHHPAPYIDALQEIGGTNINGETSFDWTAYYETVPTAALDKALWLESDRMGHLLGAIDESKLKNQRNIVLNERRETLDEPYGRVRANIMRNVFPANHPYRLEPYGLPADLEGASLDDARAWFRSHYGAANATLVMAGDITPEVAREKAMTYFAHIAPGPDMLRQQPWVAPLATPARGVMHDDVPRRRIVKVWPVPETYSTAATALELAAIVLGNGEGSRLQRRLVVEDGLASGVDVTLNRLALASTFEITVDVVEDADLAAVESSLGDELRKFLAEGPGESEITLARARDETRFLSRTERMSAKARLLARGQLLRRDPTAEWGFNEDLARVTSAHVAHAASTWLTRPGYTLTVLPAPERFDAEAEDAADTGRAAEDGKPSAQSISTGDFAVTGGWDVDRNHSPVVGTGYPDPRFPRLQRSRLSNGAELLLAERTGPELVRMRFQFDGGSASDQGRLPGTARFVMSMLERGTDALDASAFEQALARLGATLESGCETDVCFLDLALPPSRLARGLALMTDAVRRSSFRSGDIEHVRRPLLAVADNEQLLPSNLATSITNRSLFGENHPYAEVGAGTHASIMALDAKALEAYRHDFLRPDNLRVIVVGNVSAEACVEMLNVAFGDWVAPNEPLSLPNLDVSGSGPAEVAYLVDKPGAQQSHVALTLLAPPAGDAVELDLATIAFIDSPGSRLNANMRDAKGWTYGVWGGLDHQRGARPLSLHAPVQADRTGDAVAEISREVASFAEGRSPLSTAEFERRRWAWLVRWQEHSRRTKRCWSTSPRR